MAIQKVKIENYKTFKGLFILDLNPGMNIIVGDNEEGKSTILEAIHLALTGLLNGKYVINELTQSLFNIEIVQAYIDGFSTGKPIDPPTITIELFFEPSEGEIALYMGNNNSDKDNEACGICCRIAFDEQYRAEYENFVNLDGGYKTLPIEFYEVSWSSFARKDVKPRSIPLKAALIDSSSTRYQNGSDIYISRIVRQVLEPSETAKIAQAHRKMRETFREDSSIQDINKRLGDVSKITEKKITLSVELLSKTAWESSLMTFLDEVPFHQIGKGEQSIVKTRLAMTDMKTKKASIILMEEPENHLSHTRLNALLKIVSKECLDRQVVISTHNSFVANKLNLSNLILLDNQMTYRLKDSISNTSDFFHKLPGYDTLRIVLCRRAILVEGASDELIVQKAYMKTHGGKLPIEDEIEVISVGTSFLRFLEISKILKRRVAVITDNDGKIRELEKKYESYLTDDKILISYDDQDRSEDGLKGENYNYNTLENLILLSNSLTILNSIFATTYISEDLLRIHMKSNKTECALKIFNSAESINFPEYILKAISHVEK
nr:AAA family ATPase [uncultured Sphaerochaeta sp.]